MNDRREVEMVVGGLFRILLLSLMLLPTLEGQMSVAAMGLFLE